MKTVIAASAALTLFAAPAMAAEYATIEMELDVDVSAEALWEAVGDYCDIAEWGGLACEITAGENNEVGAVRTLTAGPATIEEILIGKTELSYGYAQPAVEGRFYDLYHGFMEARPTGENTSKIVYTLMYDVSNLEDQAAKDENLARRRTLFEGMLVNMKNIAEGNSPE